MIPSALLHKKPGKHLTNTSLYFIITCLVILWYLPAYAVELKPLEDQRVSNPAKKKAPPSKFKYKPGPSSQSAPASNASTTPAAAAPKNRPAQPAKKKKTASLISGSADAMLFNFQDADIKAVIKTISQITKTNFILDPRVKGKVTIISAKPVSKKAAYDIFLSALKAQGFTAVSVTKGVTKIIPIGEGKQYATRRRGALKRGGEQMITQVVVVQYGNATQLVPLLRPLMAPTSQLSAYAPANALILTDFASNIGRLLNIIYELDRPVSTNITIIPIKHASALDMAELIGQLVSRGKTAGARAPGKGGQATAALGSQSTVVPDLRTNSLIVRSDDPVRVAQLKALILKLDVPAKSTGGNTRVIYLKNADAKSLVEILRGLLEAATKKQAIRSRGAGAKGVGAQTQTSLIQADEDTNSLIINASDAVYNNIRGVIEKLDIRRAQVYVEALIVEITSDNAAELGFQFAGVGSAGDSTIAGATNFTVGNSIAGAITDPTSLGGAAGLTLAVLGPEITLPDGTVTRGIGGLARALETRNMANILSTPNLLTLDNAEARIVVGQNVPFLTGSFTQGGAGGAGGVNPFQTVQRKDVGLTLKIKPQITEGGSIKLEIMSEVSSVVRQATIAAQDLVTNTRVIETTILVEDGHTIVLGGLIEDSQDESEQAVPILGSIPLIGWLFKYKTSGKKKTNLMVFLRPTIVRSTYDSYRYTADRYDYILGNQKIFKDYPYKRKIFERFKPNEVLEEAEKNNEAIAVEPLSKTNNNDSEELLGPGEIIEPEINSGINSGNITVLDRDSLEPQENESTTGTGQEN